MVTKLRRFNVDVENEATLEAVFINFHQVLVAMVGFMAKAYVLLHIVDSWSYSRRQCTANTSALRQHISHIIFFYFGASCHFVNEENTVRVFDTIFIICKLVAIGKCWIHPIKENST